MFGNITLSIAAAAAVIAVVIGIEAKNAEISSQIRQTDKAVQYEKAEGVLGTNSYAKLDVKPAMLFVTNTSRDKILLNKLSDAVETVVKQNPNIQNINCSTLARTGKITYGECESIINKQFPVIIPSNPNVEDSIASNIKSNAEKNNMEIVKAIVIEKTAVVPPKAKNQNNIQTLAEYKPIIRKIVKIQHRMRKEQKQMSRIENRYGYYRADYQQEQNGKYREINGRGRRAVIESAERQIEKTRQSLNVLNNKLDALQQQLRKVGNNSLSTLQQQLRNMKNRVFNNNINNVTERNYWNRTIPEKNNGWMPRF